MFGDVQSSGSFPDNAAGSHPRADLSPGVAEALYADAIRLKRGELVLQVSVLVLAVPAAALVAWFPRHFWFLVVPVVKLMLMFVRWTAEWHRLRHTNPYDFVLQEQRGDADRAGVIT